MSRYKRADEFPLTDEQKELIRYHEEVQGGHMTNMKYTLLRKPVAFQVYMGWYDLKKDALKFLTQHEITIFCHAISSENHCLVCGTFFRRIRRSGQPASHRKRAAFVGFWPGFCG